MGLKTLEKNSGKQGFGNEVKFSRKYRKDIPNNTSNILWWAPDEGQNGVSFLVLFALWFLAFAVKLANF